MAMLFLAKDTPTCQSIFEQFAYLEKDVKSNVNYTRTLVNGPPKIILNSSKTKKNKLGEMFWHNRLLLKLLLYLHATHWHLMPIVFCVFVTDNGQEGLQYV